MSASDLLCLRQYVELQYITPNQRKNVQQRAATLARSLLRDVDEFDIEMEPAKNDMWAVTMANTLCEPLQNVHKTLFTDWTCECPRPDYHYGLLASFAMPCQNGNKDAQFTLRFTSNRNNCTPWNTVSLKITSSQTCQNGLNDSGQAINVTESPLQSLHDLLISKSKQNHVQFHLSFCSNDGTWTIQSDNTSGCPRVSMVSLTNLLEQEAPHTISKRPFKERLSLALLIAYAFLELGNSPWFPYITDCIKVWFWKTADDQPVLLQPYIEVDLQVTEHDVESQSDYLSLLRMVNREMPCLPLLGKLILEVVSGQPIGDLHKYEKFLANYKHQQPIEAPYIADAVNSCFSDREFTHNMIHGNEVLRTRFIEKVVGRLQSLLSQCGTCLEAEIDSARAHVEAQMSNRKRRRDSTVVDESVKRSHLAKHLRQDTTDAEDNHHEPTHCCHDDGSLHAYDRNQWVTIHYPNSSYLPLTTLTELTKRITSYKSYDVSATFTHPTRQLHRQ
jgi:hypothetical protein